MLNPKSFSVIYTYTSMIDTAISVCRKYGRSVLSIQQPGCSVSEPDGDGNITIFADVNDGDAIDAVQEAAAIFMPNVLVFGVGPERAEDRFTVTQSEAKIIQEQLFLHAGKAGFIQTVFHNWPSAKRLDENANQKIEEVAA